jgi:hypothetical protein
MGTSPLRLRDWQRDLIDSVEDADSTPRTAAGFCLAAPENRRSSPFTVCTGSSAAVRGRLLSLSRLTSVRPASFEYRSPDGRVE